MLKLGLDIGSTTIKCVVLDEENKIIYSTYERHYSQITEKIAEILATVRSKVKGVENAAVALSGSAGMGVAESSNIDFVQEVYATRVATNTFIPGTDVVIELGGEDAKILFLTNGLEVRMNGTCAGGTGAFIDQMATLLNVPLEDLDELAKQYEKNIHYRITLRRICKDGYSASFKPRRKKERYSRKYLQRRCKPDCRRSCTGTRNRRSGCISRRSSHLYERA